MDSTNGSRIHGEEAPQSDLAENTSVEDRKGRTPASARYLGVRQRPSGRWVAEIKVSSQKIRLWLGTFDRAEEAAMAYDGAARLLKGRNARTNFPSHETVKGKAAPVLGNPRLRQLIHHAHLRNHEEPPVTEHGGPKVVGCNPCGPQAPPDCRRNSNGSMGMAGGASHTLEKREDLPGVPRRGSRVYRSIVVAPSFGVAFDSAAV